VGSRLNSLRKNRLGILKRISSQKGVALLMVLWVLTILLVIVFSFSFMTRTEMLSTASFRGGLERKFIAEGGMERAIMELFYRNVYKNQTIELEGREVWQVDGTPYTGQLGNGTYTVSIVDESGKVDINSASELLLKNLLLAIDIPEEEADTIVDSMMDWKDSDDLHRIHGAENDYYMSLQNPYKAKNARFDSLEELLLVKGVTSDILYGNKDRHGLIDFITVYTKKNRININAAPKEVLMAIPNMTPELADSIISSRQTVETTGTTNAQGVLGENYSLMSQYITTASSNVFSIDAVGRKENEKGAYAIRATVVLTPTTSLDELPYKFVYYKKPVTITQ
jgi:general secretion pathway protein K